MKKSTLLMMLSLILAVAMGIGGTLAYLTDTDGQVNVMTVGNVQIKQNEQDRTGAQFQQGQQMLPIVTPANIKSEEYPGYPACPNYVDKIVTVTNTGASDAYVRTIIAVPEFTYEGKETNNASTNLLHWNGYGEGHLAAKYPASERIPGTETNVLNHWFWGKEGTTSWPGNTADWYSFGGINLGDETNPAYYTVYVVTHTTAVKPGETTAPNMIGMYLDSRVDYDNDNGWYTFDGNKVEGMGEIIEVPVLSQAVQAGGFDNAWDAFDAAFPVNEDNLKKWIAAVQEKTVVATPESNAVRPAGYAPKAEGETINGLTVVDNSDDVTNLRALYKDGMTGDLTIKDSYLDGTYAMNVTVANANADVPVLKAENTVFKGWTSFSGWQSATFTGCTFGMNLEGTYNHLRPYDPTTLINCELTGTSIDFAADGSGNYNGGTLTLIDCTFNGKLIENVSDLNVEETWANAGYITIKNTK